MHDTNVYIHISMNMCCCVFGTYTCIHMYIFLHIHIYVYVYLGVRTPYWGSKSGWFFKSLLAIRPIHTTSHYNLHCLGVCTDDPTRTHMRLSKKLRWILETHNSLQVSPLPSRWEIEGHNPEGKIVRGTHRAKNK